MTLGAIVLVFVAAFENLAVTTVMPVIAAELDGAELYAVAFAAPLAASVLGMVAAGIWCDRTGPRTPLVLAVGLFFAGLVVAGTAPVMELVVLGRLVQGLGSGGTTVALYVIVARVYPGALQPKVFGAFSAAWVLPALVGPFLAGVIGDTVGWRWVFLGVAALVVPAALMVAPAMRVLRGVPAGADARADADAVAETDARGYGDGGPRDGGLRDGGQAVGSEAPGRPVARILWAAGLALAVLVLSASTELEGAFVFVAATLGFVVALVALRPLTPPGTLRAGRGLPSVILAKLALAGGYFVAEIYLPYLFTAEHGLSPAAAGLSLTVSGVFWGGASLLQGRLGSRLSSRSSVRIGVAAVLLALAVVLVAAAFELPVWVAIAGWAISGTGMGLAYPRLSVLVLGHSEPERQGFNSAALNIADAAGPAMSIALGGILFQSVAGAGVSAGASSAISFAAVFALGLVLTACSWAISARMPRD
ncbi:MFS transporter [Herbiconiux moechotypicola]|uniref:MFS transporter n=1 Tax=Herbiconiux moechotypicola TaxID=637393 RepID=A0ABP5QLJ9_9MICO